MLASSCRGGCALIAVVLDAPGKSFRSEGMRLQGDAFLACRPSSPPQLPYNHGSSRALGSVIEIPGVEATTVIGPSPRERASGHRRALVQ